MFNYINMPLCIFHTLLGFFNASFLSNICFYILLIVSWLNNFHEGYTYEEEMSCQKIKTHEDLQEKNHSV